MKTARLQVLTTPAFRDWLRKEAKRAGVSVGELVRSRCEGKMSAEEENALAQLAAQLHESVSRARASLEEGLEEAGTVLRDLKEHRSRRKSGTSA